MVRTIARTVLLITACVLLAQSTKELPSFEVASLKRSPLPRVADQIMVTMTTAGPGLVTYRNVDRKSLLMTAYHLEDCQIKAPGWIDSEQYDISARVPANTPYSQRPDASKRWPPWTVPSFLPTIRRAWTTRRIKRIGMAESTVRAIFLRCLERWEGRRRPPPLRQMGVDELYRGKSVMSYGPGNASGLKRPAWTWGSRFG